MTEDIASDIRAEIDGRLDRIEGEEGIRHLLAIESGSRAWGFASPDSDYDVRFIYVRPREDYLALRPVRDVVERPILDEIDLNGWDVRKALGLMLKHNAVVSEWIESPILYRDTDPFIGRMAELGDRFFDPKGYARHYASLGTQSAKRWLQEGEPVTIKKYFYALRPAMAIRCLRMDPNQRPPMRLQDLMAKCDLPSDLFNRIEELVAIKAKTREAGASSGIPELDAFIAHELSRADEVPSRADPDAFEREANALFLDLVSSD